MKYESIDFMWLVVGYKWTIDKINGCGCLLNTVETIE